MESQFLAARAVPEIRQVGKGTDTLFLFWPVPIPAAEAQRLQELKTEAQAVERGGTLPVVRYGGEVFEMQPNGGVAGRILFKNETHMAVHIEPDAGEGMPSVYIELRSELLWQVGPDTAAAMAQSVVYEIAGDLATDEQLAPRVSWLHLCVDFQGMTPTVAQLTPRRHKEKTGGYCNEQLYTRAEGFIPHLKKRFSGVEYGGKGSVISAGFYNKSLEIEENSSKTWFEDIWKKSGNYQPTKMVDGKEVRQDVWRLEFRLRREGLTELMKEGAIENFSTWEDVRGELQGIWEYLTTRWLVMRGKRTKKSRLANPITPFWQQFVDAGEGLLQPGTKTILRTKLTAVAKRATAQAAGSLLQMHACEVFDVRDERLTFEQNLADVVERCLQYMRDKKWNTEERIQKRYLRRWVGMEHLQFFGEDVEEEVAA